MQAKRKEKKLCQDDKNICIDKDELTMMNLESKIVELFQRSGLFGVVFITVTDAVQLKEKRGVIDGRRRAKRFTFRGNPPC